MEGSQWFRLGAIVALFVGSIYVLLPTVFQVDPAAEQAATVEGLVDRTEEFEREVEYYVLEGKAEEIAPALQARFTARKVDATVFVEEDRVVVRRPFTFKDEALEAILEPAPVVRLHPFADDVELGSDDERPTTANGFAALEPIKALAGQAPPTVALDLRVASVAGSRLTVDAPFADADPLLLVVDDEVKGVVLPDAMDEDDTDAPAPTGAAWTGMGGYASLKKDVGSVAVPGVLSRVEKLDVATVDTDDTDVAEVQSVLPDWALGLLLDTRMPLGLDLQGGVDLTLQVELDEALLTQANRDMTFIEDDAEDKGLTITKVQRNPFDPIIEIQSTDDAAAVQGFIAESFRDGQGNYYDYVETVDRDGAQWHLFEMTATRREDIQKQSVTQVLDVLRKRVAETKVRDPVVVRKGGGKISVQLPGLSDPTAAVSAIGRSAVLEFKLVDPKFRNSELRRLLAEAENVLPKSVFENDEQLNDYLREEGKLPEGMEVGFEYEAVEDEETGELVNTRSRLWPLQSKVVLSGADVNDSDVTFNQNQQPAVSLEFKPAGANVFCTFTTEHVDDQFAIILDGIVQSAPSINERICGGRAQITMGNTVNATQEAQALAVVLRTGSLNAPVTIGSVRKIGPSLGEAAIEAGSIATVLGGLVVLIFMGVWYRGPGLIANIALVLNILLMLAGLSLFGWTLTLPGIAGIALTIGMAVDANIIIYERIREELKMGQHARKAVEAGFKKAAVAVLDANITTAIAGVVLFSYGNVTIQGFAVTLLMGIGTTLLTSLFVTRSLLEIVTRRATARLRI